jgi:hypothetical protein
VTSCPVTCRASNHGEPVSRVPELVVHHSRPFPQSNFQLHVSLPVEMMTASLTDQLAIAGQVAERRRHYPFQRTFGKIVAFEIRLPGLGSIYLNEDARFESGAVPDERPTEDGLRKK